MKRCMASYMTSDYRFTKDTPRFKDELDVMKFICKDFWTSVFKKQIDNLRTNHQVCTIIYNQTTVCITFRCHDNTGLKLLLSSI